MPIKKKSSKEAEKLRPSIEDQIQPVSSLENNLVMLVYGRSGTGKTQFGSTFPRPTLFIDIKERGTETIAQEENIDILRVTEWSQFEDVYWLLKDGTKYKSVVIDQITNLQDLGMAEIMRRSKKKQGELFSQRNWGQLSGMLKDWLSNFRELNDQYNVLFIAHERSFDEGEDEDGSINPNVGARVMPSVSSTINGAVDAIGCTFIRENHSNDEKKRQVDYCMRIGPHAYFSTKIRRPVMAGPLPDILVNPTYSKIIALSSGKAVVAKKKIVRRK